MRTDEARLDPVTISQMALAADAPARAAQAAVAMRETLIAWSSLEPKVISGTAGQWQEVGDFALKFVAVDRQLGTQSCFMRIAPGAHIAAHGHRGIEHCLVLEGSLQTPDGNVVSAQQMLVAQPGDQHQVLLAPSGALLFLRSELTPWMAQLALQVGL